MKSGLRKVLFLFLLLVVGTAGIGGSYAWLHTKTETKNNQFTVGKVDHEIQEEFNGQVKKNVKVKNTGNVPSFVRVKIIPKWQEKDGKESVGLVAEGTYTIDFIKEDWFEQGGFWYCKQPILPNDSSKVLIKEAKPLANLSEKYQNKMFDLQVIVQSVQAEPIDAVKELWGIDPTK